MKRDKDHLRKKKGQTHSASVSMEGLELDARRAGRLGTVEMLRNGRTPLTVIEIAQHAATLAEEVTQSAIDQLLPSPPLACAEGCAWCCYKLVGTSVPEVMRIVEFLQQSLCPEELRATQERVTRLDEQRRALRHDKWAVARLPCALLVNNRCSVYPVRPLTCRGFNSSDAHACELSHESRAKLDIPIYEPQLRVHTFVLDGMRAGLSESRLQGDLLELTAALGIGLTVPDAWERWLAGESVFAPARFP